MNKTTLCFIHKYTDLKQKSLIHTRKPHSANSTSHGFGQSENRKIEI